MAKRKFKIDTATGKADLFLAVLSCLWRYTHEEHKAIAEDAEVSYTTLYNWCNDNTQNPQIGTLTRVANVLGYDIVLVRNTKTPRPTRRLRRVK